MTKAFAVTEIWVRQRVVQAPNVVEAYKISTPGPPAPDLSLSNWHVLELPKESAHD